MVLAEVFCPLSLPGHKQVACPSCLLCTGGPGVAYPSNVRGGPVIDLGGGAADNFTGSGSFLVRAGSFGSGNLAGMLVRGLAGS